MAGLATNRLAQVRALTILYTSEYAYRYGCFFVRIFRLGTHLIRVGTFNIRDVMLVVLYWKIQVSKTSKNALKLFHIFFGGYHFFEICR